MRRLLPLSLCVATSIGLMACDDQPVSGPSTAEEQALYDFRAGPEIPDHIPGYDGNGDITISRGSSANGNGDDAGDIILWDIVEGVVFNRYGITTMNLVGESIVDPASGTTMCTTTTSQDGLFKELRDEDGTVLYSAMGLWTFDGTPDLSGNPFKQYQSLMSQLRFSYQYDAVVDGLGTNGSEMVQASAPIQLASRWRKLVIAALVDGQCGSEGIE